MKPVDRSELLDLGSYEQVREHFRARIIREKRSRRVALGPHMTVLFENHDTVLFQIQEMLRTERISSASGVLHELETYNQLIAGDGELSVTVFIEYAERDERDRMLVALAGVEQCFYITVDGERAFGRGEVRGDDVRRTTAVQYVKYPLSDGARRALQGESSVVVLGVAHPAYSAEVTLDRTLVTALAADLTTC
jgi:hypothetical protein